MDCDSERIWKIVENQRHNVPKKKRPPGSSLSLFDRLYDCYVECTQRQNDKNYDKRFRNTVNLLQQLSPGHVRPLLVVNLYSDERGYSLILNPDEQGEEIFFLYEDNEIFSYLDNQEIPPVLMEVLSHTDHCHMYGGCVVCEVRDYRPSSSSSSSSSSYDSHLLMLRPTSESILQMVNEIARETSCSREDLLLLESKLLLATQPPICLDPSTEVVWVTNRLHYNRRKFHTPAMRRYLRRRSQARRARMYHTSLQPAPSELRLHDFLTTSSAPPLRCPRPQFSDEWKMKRRPRPSFPASSATAIGRQVQELATVLPEPPATPSLSPTLDHTPLSLTPPAHLRTQGQRLAEQFLDPGERLQASSALRPGTLSSGGSSVPSPPPPPPPPPYSSPVLNTTLTKVKEYPPPTSLPVSSQTPRTHSFTISLPRIYVSRAKGLPISVPPSHTSQPTLSTTSQAQPSQNSQLHSIPTSLRVIKKPRPIAPAPPTPLHPTVATTVGKPHVTYQHLGAAVRSSTGVITTGNQRPLTTTQVLGANPVGLLNPPKLQRPSPSPLSTSTQHLPTRMPKLHRFATPSSLSPRAHPHPSSTRATPPMPILHRLATGNSTLSPFVVKATPPVLKAPPIMTKLQQQNNKP